MKHRVWCLALVTGCVGFGPMVGVLAEGAGEVLVDEPGAAHVYEYFMRPPGLGKGYDTWADANGPDVGEVDVDPGRLPSRVDNSQRPQFPPIYRQRYGTCGQYTAAATMFTYEMNVLRGVAADTDARRFPATFSWNMMNRAKKTGSEAYHGWEVAKRVGLPTIATYGSVERMEVGAWANGYEVWRDAMQHRVAGYRYTPAQTVEQLNEARGWLYDRNQPEAGKETIGGLLAMDGRMGKNEERDKVTATIPQGQYAAGQDVWTRWSASGFGHGLTCVGYDDNVGFDLNGDGQITNDIDINGDGKVTLADWERGAYIVVNSWGKNWSDDGRIYLLYSAMIDPTWKRGNYLGRIEVAQHTPRMTLKLTLSCDDRTALRMTAGIAGEVDAQGADQTISPQVFNGWPVFGRSHAGHVPMAGPGDDTPLEVGVDMTGLVDALGADGKGKVFLSLSRAKDSAATGKLHAAAVRFYDDKGELIDEKPITIGDGGFGDKVLEVDLAVNGPARQ